MAVTLNLENGQRAQRKLLITVAAWGTVDQTTGMEANVEILGVRTEDSSIELNPDIETITDILGITYSDVNKTEPQQDFDPHYVIGGSELSAYLTDAVLRNDINAYNNAFNLYIITAFIGSAADGYFCVKHKNSSIIPTAIGGDSYTNMPIEVHFSNDIEVGTVDKLTKDFKFTKASA